MKRLVYFYFLFIAVLAFCSCVNWIGGWKDNIHLSTRTLHFSSAGDYFDRVTVTQE